MNLSTATLAQYALAALAMVAMVALNIWGTSDPALTSVLTSVITAAVWGGLQREAGIKVGSKDDPPGKG